MFRQTLAATAMLALCAAGPVVAQDITDYLGVPGPITVGDTEYVLAWSSNPTPGYFKQEYLPAGATPETYESMVMVEFLVTGRPLGEIIGSQTAMIEQRKATDPIANMAVYRNDETGELILDFVLSAKDDNGEYIIEWNGYRYTEGTFEGQPGSVLFALSERAYGNADSESFLSGLREFKAQRTLDLTRADLPALQ